MSDLTVAAIAYAAQRWHVFPLRPRGKAPCTRRGFLDATVDVLTIRQWWGKEPDCNIGLAPGPSGLSVVDIDGPAAETVAGKIGLLDVPTLTVRTGRGDFVGRHLYFRAPDFQVGNRKLADVLEVKGDAGYVVAPPSVHPSGRRYEIMAQEAPAPLPDHARAALLALQLEKRDAAPLLGSSRPMTGDMSRRISAYLARVGQRGTGQRNATAFQVAAWLRRDMALPESEAWAWLVTWNAGNVPPLKERELGAVFVSAEKHGARSVGCALVETRA